MKAARSFAIACLLSICVSACHRAAPRWAGSSGGRAIPGDFTNMLHYELQGDLFTEPWDESKARPLFVILWIGAGGATSSHDWDNRLTEISGHRLRLSFTNRAVYALQPDYSVRDLSISESDLSSILDAIAKGTAIEGDLWTNSLVPRLCVVQ
jgi:hypothetical protein